MSWWTRSAAMLGAAMLGPALVATACAPPTSEGPDVLPRPPGRGTDASVAVAPSAGCSVEDPGAQPGQGVFAIHSGGTARRSDLRVPAGDGPHPLLVSLHPFTGTPRSWEEYSRLADAALRRGYAVVTPLGSQPGPRWAVPGGLDTGADDIGFVADLVDHLEDTLCLDRNAEFAAGYSAGAAMAQALSCTMPWRFAAVAGSGGANLTDACPDSPPTEVFLMHGSADPIAPPSGSEVVFAPPLGLAISEVVATNAARAGCDPVAVESTPVASVRAQDHTGCAGGLRIRFWEMRGAGHTWAGSDSSPLAELVVGPTLDTFSATEEVLDFFDGAATRGGPPPR